MSNSNSDEWKKLLPEYIRRIDILDFKTSCILNVTVKIVMVIKVETQFFVFPTVTKLSNLVVNRSDGKPLFIISKSQIESDVNAKIIYNHFLQKNLNPIFISLIRHDDNKKENKTEWMEEITINWTEEIEKTLDNGSNDNSLSVKESLFKTSLTIIRPYNYEYMHLEEASHYLELKTNDKYEIYSTTFSKDDNQIEFTIPDEDVLIKDKRDKGFRIDFKNRPSKIRLQWKIGIPKMIKNWTYFGVFLGIVFPSLILFLLICFPQNVMPHYKELVTAIGGITALILGLRLLVFHDIDMMVILSNIYLFIVLYCISISIGILLLFN